MAREYESGRGDANAWSGDPYADLDAPTGPIDIAAVRRDDALIDAIAGSGPVATDSADEYRLAALLAEWRTDIVDTPLPESPSLDEVVAEMAAALNDGGRRNSVGGLRLLRPIAGAAAAVAFALGGLAAVSYNAMPGDPLWKVKEVVFTEQADSAVAQVDTTSALEDVEKLIASGDTEGARTRLAEAQTRSENVRDQDSRAQLRDWWDRLSDELAKVIPAVPPIPGAGTTVPVPTDGAVPDGVAPDAPAVPLPSVELPTVTPTLPSDIPWLSTIPWPPDLQLPSLPFFPPATQSTEPSTPDPEILRAPVPTGETTASVPVPTTAVTPGN